MSHRRLDTMDVHALLRRLQAGETDRSIARVMRINRKTVAKYRIWAEEQRLLEGPLPDLAALHTRLAETFGNKVPPQNHSSVEPYQSEIQALLDQGFGPRLVYFKLNEHPGFTASESAVWRLCAKLKPAAPPPAVGRIETAPGEVAQVDFGDVGTLFDPVSQTVRRAYVFTMVLGWSRHMYAEFVFDQTLPTWLVLHQHAFEFFGGVPQRIVLDNLKAAIVQAYAQDRDVEVQRAYAECAEHYGFLIDPCLPGTPEHKGKVERGVGYIKHSLVPLLPAGSSLIEANTHLRQWLLGRAGLREHGTTHEAPLVRFAQTEQKALQPLPATAYDPAVWKRVKLHRDGHVVFEKAFYSAPCRFVGQILWLRAGLREIRLFSDGFELIATHSRAAHPGQRLTHPDHLPREKQWGLTASRASCQTQAEGIGAATAQVIQELLASRPVDRLRTALRVLHLAETYTPARLEAACARGLAFGDVSLATLKRILVEHLDELVLPAMPGPNPVAFVFARPTEELVQGLGGGAPWN